MLTTSSRIALVCSNKPRASTQHSRSYHLKTGASAWGRDIYHAALADDKMRTLCGRDSSEWLTITTDPESVKDAIDDFHFCTRCRAKLMDIPHE